MDDTIYHKKDIIISADMGSGKNIPYQLISLIKKGVIMFVVFLIIALIND